MYIHKRKLVAFSNNTFRKNLLKWQIKFVELQHLQTLMQKQHIKNAYSAQAVDPQIKKIFSKSAQDALNTKTKINDIFKQLIVRI